jgi:hypothetical protein
MNTISAPRLMPIPAVSHGPLAETLRARLWLLVSPAHTELAAPMRAAMRLAIPAARSERRLAVVA